MNRRTMKGRRIAVLMGGKSSERDVSLRSGAAVLAGLQRRGYDARGMDAGPRIAEELVSEGIGAVFIALHGRWGEDGVIQGLLEALEIPYTGAGVLGSSLAMDKAAMKLVFQGDRIPTPPYVIARGGDANFPLPFVVKPAREGSTIGISVVKREEEKEKALKAALKYDSKIVVEQYMKGQEITVGVINGRSLPVIEVRPRSGFYDFAAKYTKGMTEYILPAPISARVAKRATEIALKIWESFELSGCARIDMIVRRGTPYVIDINTSPGMTETSLVPKAYAYDGGTFDKLVEEILLEARLKA